MAADFFYVSAVIAGQAVFVGGYKTKNAAGALREAERDLLAMIPLSVTTDPAADAWPSLAELQGVDPNELGPIEF